MANNKLFTNYFYTKLSTMAIKKRNPILVYNSRTGKTYPIHPDMAKDAAFLAQRGLIIQTTPKPMEVTNIAEPVDAPLETAKPQPKPIPKPANK